MYLMSLTNIRIVLMLPTSAKQEHLNAERLRTTQYTKV